MILMWSCFALFFLYFVCYEIWWGLTRYKKILSAIVNGRTSRIKLYIRLMLGLWIPAALVLLLSAGSQFTLNDLGLSPFKLSGHSWPVYIIVAIAALYFLYLSYSLAVLRINAIKRVSIGQRLPDKVKALLPVTIKEKQVWIFTAFTAGITEEFLYRGFLFYLMGELVPGLTIFIILSISAVIFGIGHIYQGGSEALKAMLMGILYGLFFVTFGTIIPCIVLHVMQDLCAADMINEPEVCISV